MVGVVILFSVFIQALHVAGQVAGTSVSTSPVPYGTMASQCEALGTVTRKKLSSWLVNGPDLVEDTHMPVLPMTQQFGLQKVRKRIKFRHKPMDVPEQIER